MTEHNVEVNTSGPNNANHHCADTDDTDTDTTNNIDDNHLFDCTICHELLIEPVTLLCQHTYCRGCIKNYVKQQRNAKRESKCPVCQCAVVIPPNNNFLLKEIIQNKFPDVYRSRLEQTYKDTIKRDVRSQIEDEVRKEIFNGLLKSAINDNSQLSTTGGSTTTNTTWIGTFFRWVRSIATQKTSAVLIIVALFVLVRSSSFREKVLEIASFWGPMGVYSYVMMATLI